MNQKIGITYSAVNPGTDKSSVTIYAQGESPFYRETVSFFAVTDTNTAKLPPVNNFLQTLKKNEYIVIPSGGEYKTLEQATSIIGAAAGAGLLRTGFFMGIGGGTVCDLTAFCASIYMRGARLSLVPTTLLAMTDAAIGGKTACDFDSYKNLIGTFYPASVIHVQPDFVSFQSDAEYHSGLAEVFKTALLYDKKLFDFFLQKSTTFLQREPELLCYAVSSCIRAKAAVVERDLTETGERAYLNFGHTFAHALESLCGLGTLTHGEAVGWGIGRALDLSARLGYCKGEYRNSVFKILKTCGWHTGAVHQAAKIRDAAEFADKIIKKMRSDKKNRLTNGTIRCILQKGLCETFAHEVQEADIKAVLS